MKTTIEIVLQPFRIPECAMLEGIRTGRESPKEGTVPLEALSAEALDQLCERFAISVFKKAGKTRPSRSENELYHELLMEVRTKFPGETCHQTALRYIKQAENRMMGGPASVSAIRVNEY